MLVSEALRKTKTIQIPAKPLPVEETSAAEFSKIYELNIKSKNGFSETASIFKIAVADNADFPVDKIVKGAPSGKHWAYFSIDETGSGLLIVSHPTVLYAFVMRVLEDWGQMDISDFEAGTYHQTAFLWHRPLYDYVLTQTWRTARNVDPEEHIRELARTGYTHVEVNGLAMPVPHEGAIPGEFYSQFYAYCIGFDQYVYSELNKGIYPVDYLTANIALLKKYAQIGRKYGLEPGMLCFEPRTVPEKLLQKYPTLRGARVDHPFRSRLPRYTLTHAHPRVQAHYREMIQKIMHAVPELAYISIWSNDSGAGFEYTSSLYVGRNGGPYLIREWRTHEQIAEVAGKNIVHFMKILRDAATEINPGFRVSLRLEPFKVEHDVIMANLEKQLDIEVPSLLVRGYDLPYHHDKYKDIVGVAGSIHHTRLESEEADIIKQHRDKKIDSHLVYSQGNGYNIEPLVGIPFPGLIHKKLKSMHDSGVDYAANMGGYIPSSLAPYHINQEVMRAFSLDPNVDVKAFSKTKAKQWVGEVSAEELVKIWEISEEAIHWTPPLPLYSHFGFVWLRVWVRPIVPDLHAIPAKDRRYYEDYLVSTTNNTNLVDLAKDVLFDLISVDYGEKFVQRVDENVVPKIDSAIKIADKSINDSKTSENAREVFIDQRDRLRGFRCWILTLRSVAAWVAGVYSYIAAKTDQDKKKYKADLDDMITREIQNAKDLLELWQTSKVNFMVVSHSGETSYIYGENLGELIERKIELMETYRDVEPRIDEEIMWKID